MENAKFRKAKKVEITGESKRYKKGSVIECHPELAKILIASEVGKLTTKKITDAPITPKAVIKS